MNQHDENQALKVQVEVKNPQGVHARPSMLIVKTATGFDAEVVMEVNGAKADCKSIMEVMMLGCPKGTVAHLSATGIEAQAALDALQALFDDGFGEAYS